MSFANNALLGRRAAGGGGPGPGLLVPEWVAGDVDFSSSATVSGVAAGDLILVLAARMTASVPATTAPAGWNIISQQIVGDATTAYSLCWRYAPSASFDTGTFGGSPTAVCWLAFRDAEVGLWAMGTGHTGTTVWPSLGALSPGSKLAAIARLNSNSSISVCPPVVSRSPFPKSGGTPRMHDAGVSADAVASFGGASTGNGVSNRWLCFPLEIKGRAA